MVKTFESKYRDFVRYGGDPRYTIGSRFLRNVAATELTFEVHGLPTKVNAAGEVEIVMAGSEDDATGFITEFQSYCIPAGGRSQRKVPILENGPAVVSIEGLPEKDPAGGTYDIDALVARFADMTPKVKVADNTDNLHLEPIRG